MNTNTYRYLKGFLVTTLGVVALVLSMNAFSCCANKCTYGNNGGCDQTCCDDMDED